jgi:hypothetical protein
MLRKVKEKLRIIGVTSEVWTVNFLNTNRRRYLLTHVDVRYNLLNTLSQKKKEI